MRVAAKHRQILRRKSNGTEMRRKKTLFKIVRNTDKLCEAFLKLFEHSLKVRAPSVFKFRKKICAGRTIKMSDTDLQNFRHYFKCRMPAVVSVSRITTNCEDLSFTNFQIWSCFSQNQANGPESGHAPRHGSMHLRPGSVPELAKPDLS
jgi:hypothetical protein